jgi:hypothetical protein
VRGRNAPGQIPLHPSPARVTPAAAEHEKDDENNDDGRDAHEPLPWLPRENSELPFSLPLQLRCQSWALLSWRLESLIRSSSFDGLGIRHPSPLRQVSQPAVRASSIA